MDKFEVEDKEAYLILKLATVYDFNSYIQNYNKAEEGTFMQEQLKSEVTAK